MADIIMTEGKSPLKLSIIRFTKNKRGMIGLVGVCIFLIFALLSWTNAFDIKSKVQPNYQNELRNLPLFHSLKHPLGTDNSGKDVFAKAIVGTQISMLLGFLSGLIMIPIALFVGSLAGYYGKWVDDSAVYLMNIIVAIPGLLLIMSFVRIVGQSFLSIGFAFAITGWVGLARVIRGSFIQLKTRQYVLAAKTLGASDFRIIVFHILPNVFHLVIVNFVLRFVGIIKAEVVLAYVGLTVGTESWGFMLNEAKLELSSGRLQNFIGVTSFIFLFLISLNLLGDALRDALDPSLKGK